MRTFFPRKNTLSSSHFLIFQTFKIFWFFLSKKPHNLGGKEISKSYHSIRILKQICYLYRFWENSKLFFRKTHLFSDKKPKILNVLRNVTISVVFDSQFATFSDLKKFKIFFEKPIIFFKKPKFSTFWEILLFQSHSTANLLQFD